MAIIIKNKDQIEGIKKSCKLASETLDYIQEYVKAGVSTLELDNLANDFIIKNGAIPAPLNYRGFPKSICTSINEVVCHGIPDSTILKEGDIINIDVTTILDGYYGDTSRMYSIDPISQEASNLLKITQECLKRGIDVCKPKRKFFEISLAITQCAFSEGYSVVYQFCGHGVGLKFHESPQIDHCFDILKPLNDKIMMPGMIFTIEPMINLGVPESKIDPIDKWTARTVDNKLSAQYEHTILITDGGAEILT